MSDEDAELLLRAGDGVSTVARLLGMDREHVEEIAAKRSRARLEPEERQRIGEIRAELRGEKPDLKPTKTPPAATRPTRKAELRAVAPRMKAAAVARDAGEPIALSPSAGEDLRLARLELARAQSDRVAAWADRDAALAKQGDAERALDLVRAELTQAHERAANADALRLESEIRYSALAERADELRRAAERERDEARAEMERIGALLTKEQELRWAERKDANEKIEQLKAELAAERRESAINQKAGVDLANQIGSERDEAQRETERLHARAESAEAEVRRLAGEVRGLADLAASLRGLAADVRAMEQTYPGACESCGCPTSRTRLLVEQRDKYSKQADDARRALESYQPEWEELAARRAGTWIEKPKEIK